MDRRHEVDVFFSASAGIAAENQREAVTWARYHLGDLGDTSASAAHQRVLERSGDNLRIGRGSLFLAVPVEGSELARVLV